MPKLLIFKGNYADEFDGNGFRFMNDEEWRLTELAILNYGTDRVISFYYGSNQEMEFSDGADFLSNIRVQDVTETQRVNVSALFGMGYDSANFGWFPDFDCFIQEAFEDDSDAQKALFAAGWDGEW